MSELLSSSLLSRPVSWGNEVIANTSYGSATIRPTDPVGYATNNQITDPYPYPSQQLLNDRNNPALSTWSLPTKQPPILFNSVFDTDPFLPGNLGGGGSGPGAFDPSTGLPNDPYGGGCSSPFDPGCFVITDPTTGPGGGTSSGPVFGGDGTTPVGVLDDFAKGGLQGVADRYTGVVKNLLLGALAVAIIAIAIFALTK